MRKKKTVALTRKKVEAINKEKIARQILKEKMPYFANTTLSCSAQCSDILASIEQLTGSNNETIADKIERCRRNAISIKLLCSIIEDNMQYMNEELLYVDRLFNFEIQFQNESAHNDKAE